MNRDRSAFILRLLVTILLAIAAFIWMMPFIWMLSGSFKTNREALAIPPTIIPREITFENFKLLFNSFKFDLYLKNTLVVVLFSFLGMFLNALTGFAFAKYDFYGKNFLFALVLGTMMIPGQVTMIPVYLIMNMLKLTNTYAGMILPGLVGAYGIFLFHQFISSISDELIEAARLDGASEIYIFSRIILPLSKPILAVQGIATFIAGWNSFLWPLIMSNNEKYYTLSVGLQLLKGQYDANYGLQLAGATVMVIPVLVIFTILQKHIVEGYNLVPSK